MKHANSPCCRARIWRFGPRRRQCFRCRRTWTIRTKRRGRPRYRSSALNLKKVFLEGYTLRQLASRRSPLSLAGRHYRFRQALQRLVSGSGFRRLPAGPLVLLADGLWFKFAGKHWVLYLTALKSCSGNTAHFLDPVLLMGSEGASKWERVFTSIPRRTQARIRAIVVDNVRGMHKIARRHHWVLQLCHFHLILKLQVHRRGPRKALRGGSVREEIYWLIRKALQLPEGARLRNVMARLGHLAKGDCGTRRMRGVVQDFVHFIADYRAYRVHPELGLPSTTNAVESMGRLVREMFRRNRSGSSPKALLLWTTALLRMRSRIACNGKQSTD